MNTRQLFAGFVLVVSAHSLYAGSATWNLNPMSNDWNTAENWTPATIPSNISDVATFAASSTTTVLCGDAPGEEGTTTIVGTIVFAPGAGTYTITVMPVFDNIFPSIMEIHGQGITNNSGVVQNLVTANSGTIKASGRIYFEGASSAGENVVITNEGGASATGDGIYGGFTNIGYDFQDTASAGSATFINKGGQVSGARGGFTILGAFSYARADSATLVSEPGEVSGADAGYTLVQTFGDVGSSTFICNPATVPGAEGGWAEFDFGTTSGAKFIAKGSSVAGAQAGQVYLYGFAADTGAADAIFTAQGGQASGAEGGLLDFFAFPSSGNRIAVAGAGTNGGLGGHIVLENSTAAGFGRFRLLGNGSLDLTPVTDVVVPISSVEGDGIISLAGHVLSLGTDDVDLRFNGVIEDSGSVQKVGTGTLTLGGASTYAGGTIVTAGTVRVNNKIGSATGTGVVRVNAGGLGGQGIIAGLVTIGTGSGTGAVLAPSVGSNQLAILTLQNALTFKADSTYSYKLNTANARADQVIAKGVTIQSGAQFTMQSLGNRRLPVGTIFTAISNTSANPITGTFANLLDGSTFTAGRNNFRVSYEGGDGNDVTLTVVP
jgi:autotransporter-associated beta strand protein